MVRPTQCEGCGVYRVNVIRSQREFCRECSRLTRIEAYAKRPGVSDWARHELKIRRDRREKLLKRSRKKRTLPIGRVSCSTNRPQPNETTAMAYQDDVFNMASKLFADGSDDVDGAVCAYRLMCNTTGQLAILLESERGKLPACHYPDAIADALASCARLAMTEDVQEAIEKIVSEAGEESLVARVAAFTATVMEHHTDNRVRLMLQEVSRYRNALAAALHTAEQKDKAARHLTDG